MGKIISIKEAIGNMFTEMELLNQQCHIEGRFIVLNVRFPYDIELSRCDTHKKILHWSWHLAEKEWINNQLLRRFIELACKYHNLELDE